MPDVGGDYSESGFLRQRRNLIVGSLTLLFVQVADLRLQSHGTLLGWTFDMGRPDAIMWFLWIAVFYWLLRFYQYHQMRRPSELQESARGLMRRFLEPHAMASIVDGPILIEQSKPELGDGENAEIVPFDFGLQTFSRAVVVGRVRVAWEVTKGNGDVVIHEGGKEHRAEFAGIRLWKARILSYSRAALVTPYFTEYMLPYLLFLAPVLVGAYSFL